MIKKLLRFLFIFILNFQLLLFLLRALFIEIFNMLSSHNFEIKIIKDFDIINVIFAKNFFEMNVLLKNILLIIIFKTYFETDFVIDFATILNNKN